jgi:ribosomal protein S18 acetylase RimI-like enzyme
MGAGPQVTISELTPDEAERRVGELGALLHACVQDGASIGFVLPHALSDSQAYWSRKVLPQLRHGGLALLIAQQAGGIAGSVQLDCDTPPNQPHRAEVRKLLVHPKFRRQGIARALMAAVEALARRRGRSLITLDTRTGDAAERLYAELGYSTAGVIPDWCRDTIEDRLDPTTVMYKRL